jgi:tetratricopeptide (TPR) repeat protein
LAGLGGTALGQSAASTNPPAGAPFVVLAVEGKVEVSRARSPAWDPAYVNQVLFPDDRVRTHERSRALLRASDLTHLRMDEVTLVIVPAAPEPRKNPVLRLVRGVIHFFNRDKPARWDVETPTASAAIRGTEFTLSADEGRTVLSVLEGEVAITSAAGAVDLKSGEQGSVEMSGAPTKTAVINAVNVVQWCLYYPAMLDVEELELDDAARTALAGSLAAYRHGEPKTALAAWPDGRRPGTDAERVYLAALLLSVGRVAQAEEQLNALNGEGPRAGRGVRLADALRVLVAAVKGQPWPGTKKAERRTSNVGPSTLNPQLATRFATEWLAESYYLQSQARLEEALAAARAAAAQSPDFGLAWARLAEMEFSFGRTGAALEAVEKARRLSPRHAQALVVGGFLLSAQNRVRAALTAFEEAIALDGALGNAWLGRGLCRIRLGQTAAGREDLQVAAALEPQRALLRGYLGKAFEQSGDAERAAHELALAQKKDPNDPTAWFYSALLKLQHNRINEAVAELERSRELNENRAVYRSRLLLDQDRAVRGANLAAVYRDAGMFDVGLREAARALVSDYANYSAHLFLANAYDALRDPKLINLRYETPAFSEYLLANLLAPVGAGTLSPYVSQQEYGKLFERDRFGVRSATEYWSNGDWRQTGSQFGTFGNSSYALDVFYRSENGQRANNDLRQFSFSAAFKQQLSPQDTVFVQTVYSDLRSGDARQLYTQQDFNPTFRVTESQEPNVFVGYHREWQPGVHTLLLAGRLHDDFTVADGQAEILTLIRDAAGTVERVTPPPFRRFALRNRSELEAYSVEAQQVFTKERHTLLAGTRFQTGENETRVSLEKLPPSLAADRYPAGQASNTDLERWSVYAYDHWQVWEPLWLTVGVSYDALRYPENIDLPPISDRQRDPDRVSPKVGVVWTPLDSTTLRAAYTRSLGGLYYDTSVRLEPTQVGGFNQAFRSLAPESVVGLVAGSAFETWSVGLDHRLPTRTYLGVEGEILRAEGSRVRGVFERAQPLAFATGTKETLDFEERSLLLTINQLLGDEWSLGARYRLSEADLAARLVDLTAVYPDGLRQNRAVLHQLLLHAHFNHRCGFFAQAQAAWSAQSNHDYVPDLPGDDFWQFHLYAGYRFAQRRAEVRVGLLNLTDQDYRLNPLTLYSELPRERMLAVAFKVSL